MSSLTVEGAVDGGVPPVARAPTTVVVDGGVVLSGVVLIFVALAFVFVLHHFLAAGRRRLGARDAAAAAAGRSTSSGGRGVDVDHAASAGGKGVDPVVLRALPLTVYSAKDFAEALECAVCLADVADGEAARFLPKCGHGFHAECVDLWLRSHSTCPLCRVGVDNDKPAAVPPPPLAPPPVQPEPANYPTPLPTNVLFWGSRGAVTTTTARTVDDVGGHTSSSSGGTDTVLVIEAPAPAPREVGAAKPQGSARLAGSLRKVWSRGPRTRA